MKSQSSIAKILAAAALAAAVSGCSSFKLGAFCYVPAAGGQCAAAASPAVQEAVSSTSE